MAEGSPVKLGDRRGWPRVTVIPCVIGLSLSVGGWISRGPFRAHKSRAEGFEVALAPAADAPKPGGDKEPVVPGPTTSAPETSIVDPRTSRALSSTVGLQGGKSVVWTTVGQLGVGVTWPAVGEPVWTLDERQFEKGVRRLARRAERRPRNARLVHHHGAFTVIAGRAGRRLDRDEARRQLLSTLSGAEFRQSLEVLGAAKPPTIKLLIPLRSVPSPSSSVSLGRINSLLASYSTSLGGSSRNRRHNIRLACEAIDGSVLMPGEIFSYNETVGPRSSRAGFRTAPVIIRGELVPGTGGGICQVSTTLYNAVLLADLKVVRRSHHQFPVHYVPPGRDATVAYGSVDFRFANSLPSPVALSVKNVGPRVIVQVFGAPESRRQVRLVSSRVGWTRPRVPASGGAARPGKRVTVSRVVRMADGRVHREIVSHDVYAPAPASAGSPREHRRRGRRHRGSSRD